jgi:hypothetical protein
MSAMDIVAVLIGIACFGLLLALVCCYLLYALLRGERF